jgi:hypothetical protein
VFSSLDQLSAYHQIRLVDDDVMETAFKAPFGLLEYKVIPFGLTNNPSAFMAVMNDVLQGLKFCISISNMLPQYWTKECQTIFLYAKISVD